MIAADAGTGQILISFKRRTNDPRFTYVLQTSTNLGNWSSVSGLIQGQSATTINAEFEMVTLRLTISSVENQALIFRISVQY